MRIKSNRPPVLLLGLFLAVWTSASANLRTVSPNEIHRNATVEAKWQFPLHEKSGTQHVHVWIGEPPARQTLIIDTGSRFSATACEGCKDCGVHANRYLPRESSTRISHQCDVKGTNLPNKALLGCRMADRCFRNACQIVQQYTEGSTWTAVEVNDIVALGEEHMYEATWDGTFFIKNSYVRHLLWNSNLTICLLFVDILQPLLPFLSGVKPKSKVSFESNTLMGE